MASKVNLESLVQGIQFKDPRLYDVLRGIVGELRRLGKDIDVLNEAELPDELADVYPPAVTLFHYELRITTVYFSWERPGMEAVQYEIRQGTLWDSASRILVTSNLSASIEPLATGTHTFLIKSIDINGVYSVNALALNVIVPAISGVTISSRIIDNNVLLNWTLPSSPFQITHYEIFRNGDLIGQVAGTFMASFESQAGTYTYTVVAVDIVGNRGPDSSTTVQVSQPPDYELQAAVTSTLTGTKTNCLLADAKLLACVNLTETWQSHFTSRGWTTPQNQIDAGYPLYIQPTQLTASYVETFDFGSVLNNVIINIDWDYISLDDFVSIACQIQVSNDNVNWSSPASGTTYYTASARYVRITLNFSATDDKALLQFYNLQVFLDVKREVDGGHVTANAADVGGTTVLFNKTFKDVESITVTSLSTEPIYPIYDFVDIPNPTSFKILVFDSAGNRITRTVSWKARGVV